jgi:hypothetical protein
VDKRKFFINNRASLEEAFRYAAAHGFEKSYQVEVKPMTRTLEQNAKLWAMLGEVSQQVNWHGQKLSPEDWKHVFSSALNKQRVVPNIDNSGFVVLGKATSTMTIQEMVEMIELMHAFGAEHGVNFKDA